MVYNNLINPSNVIYSFSDQGVQQGQLVSVQPSPILYINASPGYYSSVKIQILDQNMNRIKIMDPSIVIMLSLVTKNIV